MSGFECKRCFRFAQTGNVDLREDCTTTFDCESTRKTKKKRKDKKRNSRVSTSVDPIVTKLKTVYSKVSTQRI